MFKRVMSVLLSALLLTTPLMADRWQEWFGEAYSNITTPSSDGAYLNMGSIEYRFNNSGKNWRPWVDFSGPSVKAGCNGFSLSGGFVDFSGLEDIGQQLADASGALIYGILIAIVNSLPSIEHVFSKIKEVVNWLQSMLRDACNWGKSIGNALVTADMGNGMSFKDATGQITTAVTNAGGTIAGNWMKISPEDLEKKIRDKLSTQNNSSTTSVEDQQIADEARNLIGKTLSVGATIFLCQDSIFEKLGFSVTQNNSWKGFQTILIEGNTEDKKLYLILANLLGDDGADNNTKNFLLEGVSEAFPSIIATGSAKTDLAKKQISNISPTIANAVKGTMPTWTYTFTSYIPPRWSGSKFVSELINGNDSGKLEVTLMEAIVGWAVTNGGVYKMLQPLGWKMENGKYKTAKLDWKGLKAESKEAIRCYMGFTQCTEEVKKRLLDKSVVEKLNYVNQLNTDNASDKSSISLAELEDALAPSIDQLALANSYFILKFFILNLKDKLVSQADKQSPESVAYYNKRIKQLDDILLELENQITRDIGTTNEINQFYDRIADEVRRRRSKK